MKSKLLSCVFLTKKEFESTNVINAHSDWLPDGVLRPNNSLVLFGGYAFNNLQGMSIASKAAKSLRKIAHIFEIEIETSLPAVHVDLDNISKANLIELDRCEKEILDKAADFLRKTFPDEISSCYSEKAGKSFLNKTDFYDFLVVTAGAIDLLREHEYFNHMSVIKIPHKAHGMTFSIAYMFSDDVVVRDEYGLAMSLLKMTKNVVVTFEPLSVFE